MTVRHFVHKCKGCGNIIHLEKTIAGTIMDVQGGKRYNIYMGTHAFHPQYRRSNRLITCEATVIRKTVYDVEYEAYCGKEVRVSTFKEITL